MLLAVYAAAMFLLVRPLLRQAGPGLPQAGRLTPSVLAAVLVGLLLSSYATDWMGVKYIFGAFIFGVVMPRESGRRMRQEILERLEQVSVLVLLPVFFVVSGLSVNLSCYGWSLWVFLTWLPTYLLEARGFDVTKMALFTSLPLAAGVVGDSLGGIISDRILKATGNLRLARCSLLVFGLTGALAFLVPAVRTEDALLAVYGLTASFFCLELTNAVLWSLPIDIAGRYAGTAGGMMNTGFGLAGAISPRGLRHPNSSDGKLCVAFCDHCSLLAVGIIGALFINPNRNVDDRSFTAVTR